MGNCLKIFKEYKIKAIIVYQNGDVISGYIKDYDELGFVFTKKIEEAGPTNQPSLVPWVAIKEVTM